MKKRYYCYVLLYRIHARGRATFLSSLAVKRVAEPSAKRCHASGLLGLFTLLPMLSALRASSHVHAGPMLTTKRYG